MNIDLDNPDFRQIHEDNMTELAASGRTREDLLNEVRESLRGLKQGLPLYEEIMGPQRTALHKDTLDEHTKLWKEYSEDTAGLFEDADIWELVAQVRASNVVQSSVFHRYSTGKIKAEADQQAAAKPRRSSGCALWLVLIGVLVFAYTVLR